MTTGIVLQSIETEVVNKTLPLFFTEIIEIYEKAFVEAGGSKYQTKGITRKLREHLGKLLESVRYSVKRGLIFFNKLKLSSSEAIILFIVWYTWKR